ncbi:MAG: type II secretion system protein [Candidatus Peribacteria bacterium]|nr:MAG: type II secretion system protein [Candidatus Peribacteria bacterium]
MKFLKKEGFTLVELIVVIVILAILGTIAVISFQGYSKSSRDAVRSTDLSNIKKSLELFAVEKGIYPPPSNGTPMTFS